MTKLEEFKKLVTYYDEYIKEKKEYIDRLNECRRKYYDETYYYYQYGLLNGYEYMLNKFKELLGEE